MVAGMKCAIRGYPDGGLGGGIPAVDIASGPLESLVVANEVPAKLWLVGLRASRSTSEGSRPIHGLETFDSTV
jgi:hypothetical protein